MMHKSKAIKNIVARFYDLEISIFIGYKIILFWVRLVPTLTICPVQGSLRSFRFIAELIFLRQRHNQPQILLVSTYIVDSNF